MEEFKCVVCTVEVLDEDEALECDLCTNWQHVACGTGISRSFYRRLCRGDEELEWTCANCSSSPSSDVNSPSPTDRPVFESTRISLDPQPIPLEPESFEESLADPVPATASFEDGPITYQVVTEATQRGKTRLVDSAGHSYTRKTVKNSQNTTYWRCSVRNKRLTCKATITEREGVFTPGASAHICQSQPGLLTVATVTKEVKARAKENVFQSAGVIVETVLQEKMDVNEPCPALPNPHNLAKAANRARQHQRPVEPRDLEFDIAEDHIPTDFLIGDVSVGQQRHLVFSTPEQLAILARSKAWYLDGTFSIVKEPFRQLFSVHAFVRSGASIKQVPLVFCLMSRRKKADYRAILLCILDNLPSGISVRTAVCDFEAGIWNAVRSVLPHVGLQGCVFHWTQAVFRKVQKLGLETAYLRDAGTYTFVKKLLALPYLPAEEIRTTFQTFRASASTPKLHELLDYVESTWMDSSVWPVRSWSVFGRATRTNNDVEGWHRRLNDRARRPNIQFYLLVDLLHREALYVNLQVKLVCEGKLRRVQRACTREKQSAIFGLWGEYEDGRLSIRRLLTEVAKLNAPTRRDLISL